MSHGFIAKTSMGVLFSQSVAMNCAQFAFYAKGAPGGMMRHCVAYNSTIGVYLTDNSGVAPPSTGWTLIDNVLLDNATAIRTDAASDGELASDYNVLYGAGDAARIEGVTYATLALYQAGESQDAHSLAVDPGYADPTYGGFLLPDGSPLLTAGSDGEPIGRQG